MKNLNTKNIIINPDLNLFNNQYGVLVRVYDKIIYCIVMPNVKFGEIVNAGGFFKKKLRC